MRLSSRKLTPSAPRIWVNKFGFTILILLNLYGKIVAELTCHQCQGINCLRTSYSATQKCTDSLDICATIFDGQTVVAQGCLMQLSEKMRDKCNSIVETTDEHFAELNECVKCNENLCNNFASASFKCIQCDSKNDENCRSKPESLTPTRCPISRTPNEYCFVKREGEQISRGCSYSLEEQVQCLSSEDCMICQASEINGCNAVALTANGNDNGSAGSGAGEGGSANGSGGGGTNESGESNDTNNGGTGDEPDGSGNNNGTAGSGTQEGGSTNGSGGSGTTASNNDESVNKPGGDGSSGSGGGSEDSNSGNESNGNENNNSQGGSSDSGGSSNKSSIILINSYILILSICNYLLLVRY